MDAPCRVPEPAGPAVAGELSRGGTARIDSFFAGAAALVLYGLTASRHIGLPDSAVVLEAMRNATLSSHVCNHNLNNLLGHLVLALPGANAAWKANLLSALYGAAAIGLFHAVLRRLGVARAVAALGAAVLAVSHSMWWHSTMVENYALSVVFLNACLWLAIPPAGSDGREGWPRLRAAAIFLLAGLALFNHAQNGALALGGAALLLCDPRLRRSWPRTAGLCASAFALGAAPYAAVLAADLLRAGSPATVWREAIGGGFESGMFRYGVHGVMRLGDWLFLQFPSPFLLFIAAGFPAAMLAPRLRPFAAFLLTVLVANTGFFLGYETWDQFSFYLPSFVCLAALGALGADGAWKRGRSGRRAFVFAALLASTLLPPLIYPRIGSWAGNPAGYWGRRYHAAQEAYRGRYDLVGLYTDPIRHDRGTVQRMIDLLMERLPPNAVVVDDSSLYYQMENAQQHDERRPDVNLWLISPLGIGEWGSTPAEIVEGCLVETNRVFVTADTGPAAAILDALRARGRGAVRFPLDEGFWIYEVCSVGNVR
jgi:hypothetical protein